MTIDFIVELQVLRRTGSNPWAVTGVTELYRERVDLSAPDAITQITGVVANYARLNREVPEELLEILTPEISVGINLKSASV